MRTIAALFCFAGNSWLCRYALGEGEIDPASFTTLRLSAGALVLWLASGEGKTNAISAAALAAYALCFSFAYVDLSAATGALVLFSAVQVTMLLGASISGERLGALQALGLATALGGLGYLLAPGVTSPSARGTALMLLAGIAWAIYSLRGRGSQDPLGETARHFVLAAPVALVVNLLFGSAAHASVIGALAAIASGAVTSGAGYVIWFSAQKELSGTSAATVQLAVPVMTALGGVPLLGEALTSRLVSASILVLAGIALTLPMASRAPSRGLASKTMTT